MGRGNTSFEKRRREKEKREKKEMKRARRDEKNAQSAEPEPEAESQDELMAQFAELGRRHAAGEINDAELKDSRNEIFEKLGLPVD